MAGRDFRPETLSAIILRKLVQDAELRIGPINCAVITVPAYFAEKSRLLTRYERLIRTHRDLQVRDGSSADKITVAAISVLAERSAERIEDEVRKALSKKGYSDRLIQAACDHVHEQFVGEIKEP